MLKKFIGGAMILENWHKNTDAIVEMWLGGEGAGGAIADILTGKISPSGKLTETFPKRMRRDMEYPGDGIKIRYNEGMDIGYRYYDKHTDEILYPFGYGLSYTEFEYSDPVVELLDNKVHVGCKIKNTGKCDGSETVQLYVSKADSGVTRPIKELKAFNKIYIRSGEVCKVKITISEDELAYFNCSLNDWVVEPGEYIFYIAASSQDIRLKMRLDIMKEAPYTVNSDVVGVGMLM